MTCWVLWLHTEVKNVFSFPEYPLPFPSPLSLSIQTGYVPMKPVPLVFPRHLHFRGEWLIPVDVAFCFSLSVAFCLSLCNGSRIIWGEVPVVHHTYIKPSFAKEVITQIKQCTNRGGTAAPTHLISVASTKYVCQIWWVLFVAFPFLAHNGI